MSQSNNGQSAENGSEQPYDELKPFLGLWADDCTVTEYGLDTKYYVYFSIDREGRWGSKNSYRFDGYGWGGEIIGLVFEENKMIISRTESRSDDNFASETIIPGDTEDRTIIWNGWTLKQCPSDPFANN